MAEFEIEYIHNGAHRVAVIYADDHRDAYQAFESMKSNGVIGDEIVERGDAGIEVERRASHG
ncbi:hypothetical protein [Pseudomonas citronellolis]|uniref:hypothetical protein n=1 Tax=Pseudomonas citronellolis TaxID=53408 RepID=UPI0007187E89|nr:hypothetical protein [Pseudomonas citronellolis]KRV72606.1 hypothetical protein AO742_18390 [Pseudomonas citronellolis]KRW77696.1 hypothetical protein AO738_03970 [Pseudomonas citronellolis]